MRVCGNRTLERDIDGFHIVLAGRARFYGRDNGLFAESARTKASSCRAETPYASEAADCEVQLLAVDGIDKTGKDTFVSHKPGSEIVNFAFFSSDGVSSERSECHLVIGPPPEQQADAALVLPEDDPYLSTKARSIT